MDIWAFAVGKSADANQISAGASALAFSGGGREAHTHGPLANTADSTQARIDSFGSLPAEEVRRIAKGLRCLSSCGGPERSDGIDKYVIEYGAAIDAYDSEISERREWIDDSFWRTIKNYYESGIFIGGGSASPCSTFAASRRWDDGGLPSLLGEFAPEIFGLKKFDPESKEEC